MTFPSQIIVAVDAFLVERILTWLHVLAGLQRISTLVNLSPSHPAILPPHLSI